ncbi:MAG: GNAT family N-acetyltransferase [Clostridia bacterium]|nr:GNAT family N-acetyltransferase [Clostridia bacterium]
MKYYNEITLKDGKSCILRSPAYDDGAEILTHMILTSDETDNMLRYPDEIKMTADEEACYLQEIFESDDRIMICAVVDGKIVANGGFYPVLKLDKCRHRAEFGISVKREYWGKEIGSHILSAVIETARQAGYTQLELDVVTDNTRAVALYKKFGFTIFGTNDRAFRLRNGEYKGLHLMTLGL